VPRENVLASSYDHPRLPLEVQQEFREQGLWEGTTLAQCVREWAERDPDRVAVVGDRVLTYGEVWEEARRLGGALQRDGIEPGEYLLAILNNSWQGIVLEVAASLIGAVFTPRSPHMSPTLAVNVFEQLDIKGLVIFADLLRKPEWVETFQKMVADLPGRPVVLQGDVSQMELGSDHPTLETLAVEGPAANPVAVHPTAPSLVLATGGTTGTPKSILHCADSMIYAARNFAKAVEYTEDDVTVAFAPYGHAGGSIFDIYLPLIHGAKVLPLSRWRATEVAPLIARWKGTFFVTMGTHVYDLMQLPESDDHLLDSVRVITSGAGPDTLFEAAQKRYGFTIVRAYGCGEAPGHAIGRPSDPVELRVFKDGVPFDGIVTRVTGPDGGEVPNGVVGNYECRGPNLFMGYVGQPELTDEAISPEGFYRSGDRMVMTDDGYITWSGRSKEIIRRGGLQIDPVEMESMLVKHAAIESAVVVGEPHERLGERAVVVVMLTPERSITLEEICEFLLEAGLPKQSLPERLVVTHDLPRTELGKFHRERIRKSLDSLGIGQENARV
jgi:acyl-coenzyme A synthetase/AMP-(fatty) acid ligase